MRYRIFIINFGNYYNIELHNLEVESDSHNLCNLILKQGIEPARLETAISFAEQLKIVLGPNICDIVEASNNDSRRIGGGKVLQFK